jgi:hypothetical protein
MRRRRGSAVAIQEGYMKFRVITLVVTLCSCTALTTPVYLSAQEQPAPHTINHPALVQFDAPGAATASSPVCAPQCGTLAYANNDLGAIVGFYTDKNIVPHGFLRTVNGTIVSFDAPGAGLGKGLDQGTVAYSINDLGVIAGQYQDSNYVFHGFVRYLDGSFKTFDAPGAGTGAFQGTLAFNINLEGATAGIYIDGSNVYHGFVRSPHGEITSFDPPGSTFTYPCEETCLNLEGAITGFYLDANYTYHGFVREPNGKITEFDGLGAGTGNYLGTIAASINLESAITGYVNDSNNVGHGFVRTPSGEFTTFDVPGASGLGTAAFSINLFGAVTGEFFDANNVMHGFSRSARGTFATFSAPDGGTGAFQGTRPSTNNLEGAVTGWYVDANGLNHGFVWTP